MDTNDLRAVRYIRPIYEIENYYKDSSYYVIKHLSINSRESDFSPAFSKNRILLVSSRDDENDEIARSFYYNY